MSAARPGRRVVVVGAGGNIGSHLVPHLARMPGVTGVVLIDRDRYEAGNLTSQDMTPRDVGKRKAHVQARRLRRLAPELEIDACAVPVEDLPLGRLRGDVVVACLDSRRARQYVNEAAWRLGVPWVDAGVDGDGQRARVNVYVPGEAQPCLECAWDDRDYAQIEQSYPCAAAGPPPPTRSTSELGAIAAALEAVECRKLLEGRLNEAAVARQVLLDLRFHRQHVTSFRWQPTCRRGFDHAPWEIEPVSRAETLGALARRPGDGPHTLRVSGRMFAGSVRCEQCGHARRALDLLCADGRCRRRCPQCRLRLVATGFARSDRVELAALTPAELARPLEGWGLRIGDVLSIAAGDRTAHFELRA